MLKPEIKEKWVTALRSGNYIQGQHVLRQLDSDTYCCLGVLCDLYQKETEQGEWQSDVATVGEEENARVFAFTVGGYSDTHRESHPVRMWATTDDVAFGMLAEMNDEGYTFAQIADYIEANL